MFVAPVARAGRPQIASDLRALIKQMSIENPLWGAPRIHGELLKLGFDAAASSVAKYMLKRRFATDTKNRLTRAAEAILGGCRPLIWTYFRAFRSWRSRVRYRWLRALDLNLHLSGRGKSHAEADLPPAWNDGSPCSLK